MYTFITNDIKIFQYDLKIKTLRADVAKTQVDLENVRGERQRTGVLEQSQCDSLSTRFHQIKKNAFDALFHFYRWGRENPSEKHKTDRLIGQLLSVTEEVVTAEKSLLQLNPDTRIRTKWFPNGVSDVHPHFQTGIITGRPSTIQWGSQDESVEEACWNIRNPGLQSNLARVISVIDRTPKIMLVFLAALGTILYNASRNPT